MFTFSICMTEEIWMFQRWDANIIHSSSDTCNLDKVHEIPETLFTHTSLPRSHRPKHPVKWRRYTTANIGSLVHSTRCDQFSAFVYVERARVVHGSAGVDRGCEGDATYSFRSFRRAANQPTDRPTEVTSGANCGGCCGTACERRSRRDRELKQAGGWLGPAGKRIAAREPPKLDYSCHATLNGVTHVRDDRDPVASRAWADGGIR